MNENRATSASASAATLARRTDIVLGNTVIRPSTRSVEGTEASATLEPKVMLVLLTLIDAEGAVLGRDELMSECWPGVIVGDDAVNRAIGEIRRVIRETGASFEIETIPRVGYRFVGGELDVADTAIASPTRQLSRRKAIALGALAVAGLGGAGYRVQNETHENRMRQLIEDGRRAYLLHDGTSERRAQQLFEQATHLAPDRADAWGWLSASILARFEGMITGFDSAHYDDAMRAAARALALDPQEPNALTVMTVLQEGLRDWQVYETELEAVLAASPDAIPACEFLTAFLQGLGYCRASLKVNNLGIAHEPFSPVFQQRRGFKNWIFGRIAEADRTFEWAMRYWPTHLLIWHSYMVTLAFTGRPAAARRVLDKALERRALPPQPALLWQTGLAALESGTLADIASARDTALRLAPGAQGLATNALMILSHLGELDAAYAIAEAQLQSRGRLIANTANASKAGRFYADESWRHTLWMFTPAGANFRQDSRFTDFCEAIGYLDYWRRRGIWPDDLVRGSLRIG